MDLGSLTHKVSGVFTTNFQFKRIGGTIWGRPRHAFILLISCHYSSWSSAREDSQLSPSSLKYLAWYDDNRRCHNWHHKKNGWAAITAYFNSSAWFKFMQLGIIESKSNLKNPTHRFNFKLMAAFKDKLILYSDMLAKYLATFFKIFHSSSICLSWLVRYRIYFFTSSSSLSSEWLHL